MKRGKERVWTNLCELNVLLVQLLLHHLLQDLERQQLGLNDGHLLCAEDRKKGLVDRLGWLAEFRN